MRDIRNREAARHAQSVKNILDLFWFGTMPTWAVDAIAQHSAELHAAVFPREKRGPAKILQFVRKGGRGCVGSTQGSGK